MLHEDILVMKQLASRAYAQAVVKNSQIFAGAGV